MKIFIWVWLKRKKTTAIYGNVALVPRLIDDLPTTFYDSWCSRRTTISIKPVYLWKKAPLFGVAYHFQGNPPFWVGCILYGIDILKWPSQLTMKWRSNKSDTNVFTSILVITKSGWDETVQKNVIYLICVHFLMISSNKQVYAIFFDLFQNGADHLTRKTKYLIDCCH